MPCPCVLWARAGVFSSWCASRQRRDAHRGCDEASGGVRKARRAPAVPPEGGTGPSVPRDSDTALSCGLLRSVNVATAAHLLGVSRRSVQYMLEDGRLEGTRIPPRGWWRISRASLARLLPPDGSYSS